MFGRQKSQQCRIPPRSRGLWISGLPVMLVIAAMAQASAAAIDNAISGLEAEVSRHAASVHTLEQKLRKTIDTRVAVYLSLANPEALDLDSVELFLNGRPVGNHLFTLSDRDSLEAGRSYPLFTGHMADGNHQLTAVINARAVNKRFVRREVVNPFRKVSGAMQLQMSIDATGPDYEPRVSLGKQPWAGATPSQAGNAAIGRPNRQKELLQDAEQARQQGRLDKAGQILAGMKEGYLAAVGYMNLAADFAETDLDPSRALVALRVAMSMAAHDSESARSRDLLDQLHLRAGYLALNNEEYDKALGFLEKVSLDSYHAPRALYLHGLALSGKENHRGAMQSWHRAKKFPLAFPGVAEAWIGMGRGYDIAGYPGQAGESWLAANVAFEGERTTLSRLADGIKSDGAYKTLVTDARGPQTEWFLSDSRTLTQPRMAYLLRFLEKADTQIAVRRVAGLDEMSAILEENRHNLEVFARVIEHHGGMSDLLVAARELATTGRALGQQVLQTRQQASGQLDELALAFVANEDRRMEHAIDRTEQQVAHLYEYLALEKLAYEASGEGAQ
ncbi:AraC family transcriptional regulator [Marinobacter vinifirmus]|uniref:AraC family transcriptional regulator n=2 Tax=Marinobacter vinifirmus TaxID=355591 RepID=A0A7Z1DYI4_9GAMM|nr:AraC family transcriptional regulator [Marinobacter vinifirmus]